MSSSTTQRTSPKSEAPAADLPGGGVRPGTPNAFAVAHARFARAALTIYLATAAVSVALLITALYTDKAHDEDQTRDQLVLETDVRAHSLGQRLGLLVDELKRLSLRSEVDLRDQDLSPEKSLLQLSHEGSTFFNLGVAILDKKGDVVWSEPEAFLARGLGFGAERWFGSVRTSREFRIVPVQPDRPDSVLYVVSPLIKNGEFDGALLGAIDLARGESLRDKPSAKALTVLATRDGTVVYPPIPPTFSGEPVWRALCNRGAINERAVLGGEPSIVAASPVSGSDLVLLSVARQEELFRSASSRLRTRITTGLGLALTPAFLLLFLLQRSLRVFRRSEEDAVREERLRLLGEAANSIAHEVKNALNGLSMGLDLVVRPTAQERKERILTELRREIQRLSEFTTELMTFSRGVAPRRAKLDLAAFVPKVTGLLRDAAAELGAEIDVIEPADPVYVEADGALLHAVISNLAGNALDAATAGSPAPRVEVRLAVHDHTAELRVSDNGRGVSPTMKPRLFEPFQTEKANGVGIGLALARKIARAHGGELALDEAEATRTEYPGASFVLTLPLLEEP